MVTAQGHFPPFKWVYLAGATAVGLPSLTDRLGSDDATVQECHLQSLDRHFRPPEADAPLGSRCAYLCSSSDGMFAWLGNSTSSSSAPAEQVRRRPTP